MYKSLSLWIARAMRRRQKPDQALKWYERCGIEAMSLDDRAAYAGLLQRSGRYAEAVAVLSALLTDAPNPSYCERRAQIYLELGKEAEAIADLKEAIRISDRVQPVPHYYLRLALALEQSGRSDEALGTLREGRMPLEKRLSPEALAVAIRSEGAVADAATFIREAQTLFGFLLNEARMLENAGMPAEALAAIGKALALEPEAEELLLREGSLLRQLKRYPEAEEKLLRLKERRPDKLSVYMELSSVYRLQGMYGEAIAMLQDAKQRFADNRVVQYWLADVFREADRLEEALEENRALTELEPEDPLNWKQRAELAVEAARYTEADEAYTKVMALEESADHYMRRSFVRYLANRYEEAMMDMQAAFKLDESLLRESKTAYAMGELYAGMESWELADAAYARALALEPDNSQIYERRARTRMAAGRLAEALDDCSRGLQLDPNNARLMWLRGLVSFRLDDYDAALMDSLVYSRLVPNDPQGHYNLGVVYNRMNRHDEAIASFTKVLEINPFEAQAYLERASIWYHHAFDRGRAADDLAQWLLYAGGDKPVSDRFALLNDLRGFDDEMRERAKTQFLHSIGEQKYLM